MWSFWYAQSLVVAGDPESALEEIDNLHADSQAKPARTLILKALAKKSGDSSQLLKHLQSCYEETKDPSFILEACKVKAYEKDWSYVAQRAELLANDIGTADAIRLAAIAAFNKDCFDLCLALLEAGRKAFPNQKLPNELRRLRVLSHHRLGTLPAAVLEAESLAQEEPTIQNIVALAQIYFDKGDFKRLTIIARQLSDRTDLSAEQVLRIARLIQVEDRDLAVTLWRRSLQTDLSADETAMAISLGYQLGLDDELRPLLGKMAADAASGIGPVKLAKLEDLRLFIEQRRVQGQTLLSTYRDGSAPVHLIADAGNIPLADLYHRLLDDNAVKCDPLHEPNLFARHGGRSLAPGFSQNVPDWRLNLDITAILLAEHLEILETVTKAFKLVRFSAKLIPSLIAMRDQILHEQPSRVRACQEVVDLEKRGQLYAVDYVFASNEQNELLVQELGAEWVSLFEKAREDNGYLVDFLPLTKPDLSGPPSALPHYADKYLINSRSVVEALRQQGPLTRDEYLKAVENLGDEGEKSWDKIPPQGAILYCEGTIPSLLSRAGLLSTVCSRFRVKIEKRELERLKSEIRSYELRNTLAQWVTRLIDRLRDGLDNGSYEVIPPFTSKHEPRDPPEAENSLEGLTISCLTDLLQFPTCEEDVLWVDDRNVNAYSHREGASIITICEVLKALVSSGVLQPSDYYAKIAKLRASNVKFIPIQREELLYQLNQAEIDDTKRVLIETQNLVSLRRYIATCLLQVDTPQWPPMPKGSPNEYGELNFFVSLGRAITATFIELWKSGAEDDLNREARSTWLITNLFQEHMGLNNAKFQQRSEADYQYVVALRLADLVSASISLRSPDMSQAVCPFVENISIGYTNGFYKNALMRTPIYLLVWLTCSKIRSLNSATTFMKSILAR